MLCGFTYDLRITRRSGQLRGSAYANFPHDALAGAQLLPLGVDCETRPAAGVAAKSKGSERRKPSLMSAALDVLCKFEPELVTMQSIFVLHVWVEEVPQGMKKYACVHGVWPHPCQKEKEKEKNQKPHTNQNSLLNHLIRNLMYKVFSTSDALRDPD